MDAETKERLKAMRQDRGYIKGGISRVKNFCTSEQFSQSAPALLHEMRIRLVTSLKQYDDINREILRLCPDDSEDYFATEEKYFTSIAAIDSALKNAADSTTPVANNSSKPEGEFKRLPAINIQTFDGKNIADYYPFINMFKSVIHADEKLGLCEKLYYLRTFLCGEALDLIKNLTLTDENYMAALELLKNRYDNIPKIINYHINCLLDLPSFTKCTASNLRSIVTNVQLHLAALKNLKQPVQQWDVLLVNILAKKVDTYTYRGFHLERNMKEVPTLCEFLEFLEKRATAMETMTEEGPAKVSKAEKSAPKPMSGLVSSKSSTCKYCTQSHKLYECAKFKMATEQARADFVKDKKLCIICLNEHKGKCLLRLKCATCNKKHNTLMHSNAPNSGTSDDSNNNNAAVTLSGTTHTKDILLPTAMVRLITKNGTFCYARALLDSGSQVSFISEALASKVDCKILQSNQLIAGICNNTETINKKADVAVYSSINEFKIEVSCAVVKNITCQLPQQSFDVKNFNIPSYAKLADKKFNQTGEISLLLGCDVFFQVLQRESLPLAPSGPFLVNTSFGYVVAGSLPVPVHTCKISSANLCLTAQGNNFPNLFSNAQESPIHEIDTTMSHFWECEKVPAIFKEGSTEHQLAEQVFRESVKLENKRFSVALPLKVEVENVQLGNSFSCALQRLYNLEKRFCKDSDLYKKYKKFIEEYIEQGHARYFDISNYNLNAGNVYFLPHHPVINPNSKTTPVRAVFDASMKSKNNLSLNDIMLNGAVVQSDLFDILTLFRTFKFVLLCDIKAMYRQVLVDEKYCCLQNILWRDSQHDPVRCIQLQTVTYGLKSSAFLATRCLIELAQKYKEGYPSAAFALQHSSYVDDIQCGSNDICELTKIKQELIELMNKASFSLHKWCSNHKNILKDIPSESQHLGDRDFDKNNVYVKTLGLTYDVASDTLNMKCPEKDVQKKYTKRQMLSFISKFFDPLGLVGPILVQAKYLMQQVWFEQINWDDELPSSLNKKWVDFAQSLVQMSCISIPRNINVQSSNFIEIVGFADASNIAYGCCLYLRVIDTNKNVKVNLLCSRSRINPKNKILTVPRLELNSALLLALLAKKVYDTLSLKYNVKVFLYLDSQIALSWLKIEPVKLSVYVANRVNKIRELTTDFQWSYVKTIDNPADCLSRGVDPQSLEGNLLWWHGPQYLQNSNYIHSKFQNNEKLNDDVLELQSVPRSCNPCNQANSLHEFCEKYSSIDKMTRVMSYIKRFIFNCRKENVNKKSGNLSPEELESALHTLIKIEQSKYLETEIKNLLSKTPIKSNLNSLNPFLDTFGLLRVGGRLQNANLPFSKRHPIIIPKGSAVSKLIILKEHLRLKHAGQKLILSALNEQYWLINANREIKSVIHKCVICFKLKAKSTTQLMGSLPIDRVNITRPFQIVGTDYGGPFRVKQTRVRNPVITKAYIVIFVCFVTKAIHIELASDMTTNTFLGCLKRFIARRNKPSKIYCDNGSCYKGASNVLNGLFEMHTAAHQDTVINYCNTERITFHFIPSYSPVFGGLWEAGIKSVKYHLKRVIGDSVLTYEELYTVLVQVESILNSRPLTPMSRDPDDMSYLTPGHFLTGSPLTSYPELNVVGENIGKLSFWKQCVKMQQQFWDQWHKQYLVMLQNRPKWKSEKPNLEKGTLVLLRDNNVAPLNWPMGRIVDVMPGKDGKVRAIQVKTTKGTVITTSLMKVCPLPIDYS